MAMGDDWEYMTARVARGGWVFEPPFDFAEQCPHCSLSDLLDALSAQGWELAPLSGSRDGVMTLRRQPPPPL